MIQSTSCKFQHRRFHRTCCFVFLSALLSNKRLYFSIFVGMWSPLLLSLIMMDTVLCPSGLFLLRLKPALGGGPFLILEVKLSISPFLKLNETGGETSVLLFFPAILFVQYIMVHYSADHKIEEELHPPSTWLSSNGIFNKSNSVLRKEEAFVTRLNNTY